MAVAAHNACQKGVKLQPKNCGLLSASPPNKKSPAAGPSPYPKCPQTESDRKVKATVQRRGLEKAQKDPERLARAPWCTVGFKLEP
jgi:hypothetical protein